MIEAIDLSVKIGKKQILKNLNFVIHEREKIAIIGPNGAGKTTLMRVLGGMLPYEGKLIINGKEISEYRRQDLAKLISYVPQIFYTPYTFTVEEFVKMGKYISIRNWWNAEGIDRYLDEVGILNLKARYVNTISGGELQKVLIARALAQNPRIIMLDEPTSHLDPKAVFELNRTIINLEKTVISVVHDINAAFNLYSKIMIMANGQLYGIFSGKSKEFVDAISRIYQIEYEILDGKFIVPKGPYFQ